MDEFQITAFKKGSESRVWTRSSLDIAKFIADQAVEKLGYEQAEVRNIFGGDVSDVLYEAKAYA